MGQEVHQLVEKIKTKELLMLSVNTTITAGIVEKIEKEIIELNLNLPIISLKGDNV